MAQEEVVAFRLNVNGVPQNVASINELEDTVKDLEKTFKGATFGTAEFAAAQKEYQAAKNALSDIKSPAQESSQAVSELGSSAAGAATQFGPIGAAVGIFGSLKTGVLTASKAFKTLRGAIISTGIGALAVALGAVINFLTQFREGVQLAERVSAGLGAVVGVLSDKVSLLGKAIIGAFTDPVQTIKDLGQAIIDNLVNRAEGLAETYTALGRVIKEGLQGNFEAAGEAAEDLGDAVLKTVTGLEDAAGSAGQFTQEILAAAAAAADLKRQEQELAELSRELLVENARLTGEQEKQRGIAEDTRRSFVERTQALRNAARLEAQVLANKEKELATELDILKANQAISDSNDDELRARAELEAELIELQNERQDAAVKAANEIARLEAEGRIAALDRGRIELENRIEVNRRKIESDRLTTDEELALLEQNLEARRAFTQEQLAQLGTTKEEQQKATELRKELAIQEAELDRQRVERVEAAATAERAALESNASVRQARLDIEREAQTATAENAEAALESAETEAEALAIQERAAADLLAQQQALASQAQDLSQQREQAIRAEIDGIEATRDAEGELTKAQQTRLTQLQDELTLARIEAKQLQDDIKDGTSEAIEALSEQTKSAIEEIQELEDQAAAELLQKIAGGISIANDLVQKGAELVGEIFARQAEQLEEQRERLQEQIEAIEDKQEESVERQTTLQDRLARASLSSRARIIKAIQAEQKQEAQLERQKQAAAAEEERIAEQKRAIQEKAAKAQKAAAVAQSIANTATAVTGALGAQPWTPANFALAAVVGALGAAQIAVAASQPLPEFAEGGYTGDGPRYQAAGTVHKGEYVVPKPMVDSPRFKPTIAALESARTKGYAEGGMVGGASEELARSLRDTPIVVSVQQINDAQAQNRRVDARSVL